jgi:hypothetical protein
MSSAFRSVLDNTYGLLVDDGQLAAGAIAALAITWLIAEYAPDAVREDAGWALLAMVIVLVVANLYRAGLSAHRKRSR